MNPLLNDKAMDQAAKRSAEEAGVTPPPGGAWGPPTGPAGGAIADASASGAGGATIWHPPISDGEVSPWRAVSAPMTINGTIAATGVLMGLLLVAAAFGWSLVETSGEEVTKFPAWTIIGILVGFGCVIVSSFKPHLAKFLGPIYALAQGVVVGAISKAYNTWFDGIVVAAVGCTLAVFLVMLVLYRTRILRVTNRFRKVVITATLGVAIFYGVSLLLSLFGVDIAFFQSASLLSIGFSILVAGLAALNLALDFDFIEKGAKAGLPKELEWYGAIGLLVTIVWLYLEMLRLLAKLRQ